MRRRWRRRVIFTLLLAAAVFAGVRGLLCSPLAARRAAAKLQELYGGTVHVGSARVGLKHTILTQVALFEAGGQAAPWLTIDRLDADLTLAAMIAGVPPTRIVLEGVHVALRFDDEGRLTTCFPSTKSNDAPALETLPEIALKGGTVQLHGSDSRDLRIDAVAGSLKPDRERCVFDIQGHNPALGDWNANGWIDVKRGCLEVTARSQDDVAVTPPLLAALPFLPRAALEAVQAQGDTPVVVTLTHDWDHSQQGYRVELKPTNASVAIAAMDLAASGVSGRITVADGKVMLAGVAAQAFGGEVAVEGEVDFSQPALRVALTNLAIGGAAICQLPARWSLPAHLEGNLYTSCRLNVIAVDGKLKAVGSGCGEIRDARIAGQPTAGPIRLTLDQNQGASHLRVEAQLPTSDMATLAARMQSHLPADTGGQLTFAVAALLPLDTIMDPRTYVADAYIDLREGRIAGVALEPLEAVLHCAGGELKLDELHLQLKNGGGFTARGGIRHSEPYSFGVRLEPVDIDLKALEQLTVPFRWPIAISGRLNGSADVNGTLRPFVCSSTGSATFHHVRTGAWEVEAAKVQWHSDAERVVVEALEVNSYGGQLRGSGEMPLRPDLGGTAQLELQNLDLTPISEILLGIFPVALPGQNPASDPLDISGRVHGVARAVLSPQPPGQTRRNITVNLDLKSEKIALDDIVLQNIGVSAYLSNGLLAYRMEGRALGGRFGLDGDAAWTGLTAPFEPQAGKLALQSLDLSRLQPLQDAIPIQGVVDANLGFHFQRQGGGLSPVASGRVCVTNPAFDGHVFCSQVEGDLKATVKEFSVSNLTATLAQGTMTGRLVIYRKKSELSWFVIDLDGANLGDLLDRHPALAELADGTIDIRLRGTLGRECGGAADLVLRRGKFLGVDVAEWRAPVRWSLRPSEGQGFEMEIRDSNAQIAQGRVTAQASASWHGGLRLNGQIQFVDVDLRQAFSSAKLGNGRANGRIDFSSDRLQTADDLQGAMIATIHHTQALQFPVLRQAAPLLGQTTSATFQSGEFRARLARGVIYVEKLALVEGPIQLHAEGNLTLQGRVNLDMTANTGKFAVAAQGVRLPLAGPIASEVLSRASAALSPGLVHLHVRGTLNEPTIQVVPLPLLTERLLRFFLR